MAVKVKVSASSKSGAVPWWLENLITLVGKSGEFYVARFDPYIYLFSPKLKDAYILRWATGTSAATKHLQGTVYVVRDGKVVKTGHISWFKLVSKYGVGDGLITPFLLDSKKYRPAWEGDDINQLYEVVSKLSRRSGEYLKKLLTVIAKVSDICRKYDVVARLNPYTAVCTPKVYDIDPYVVVKCVNTYLIILKNPSKKKLKKYIREIKSAVDEWW